MPVSPEELEAARANRATDPEEWDRIKTEFAEARRAERLAAGRTIGPPPWAPDVIDYIRAHPEEPHVQAAIAAMHAAHRAERAAIGLDEGDH